jgi:O-antigen/teichoic acid export membrane protein
MRSPLDPEPLAPARPGPAGGEAGAAGASRQIGRRAIRRGLALNLVAAVLPVAVALWAVREIVGGLGPTRFGILSLAWAFINAVGILDLGLGRALTRFLAVQEDQLPEHEAAVVRTALAALLGTGLLGGAISWAFADVLAASMTRGAPALGPETGVVFRILATSIPLIVLSSGLRGVLEAFGRFDLSSQVTIPTAVLNLIVPVVMLRLGAGLPALVLALMLLRLAGTLLLVRFAVQVMPALRAARLCADGLRSVLAFAGWVTVSNVAGQLIAQGERFILGGLTTLAAVSFYSTPADILSRMTVVPVAVLQVTFPVFAQAVTGDPPRAARLANRTLFLIAAGTLPALGLLVAVAPEGLRLWLGPDFARHGAAAGRLLAVAVFVNCMAWLPSSLVQSAGRARWTGQLQAVEVPAHFALSAACIWAGGVVGAAIANLVRVAVDAAVVLWMATRVLGPGEGLGRRYVLLVGAGVVLLAGAAAPVSLAARLLWVAAGSAATAIALWRHGLGAEDRRTVSSFVSGAWRRVVR